MSVESKKKQWHSDHAPAALGPYSQAVEAGGMVYLSGQIPLDPQTGALIEGGIKEQTHQVMKNLKAVLVSAGLEFASVLKANIFLKSMEDFPLVNEVYGSYLKEPYPARACVEVARLPKDVLVEIEMIAYRS